jgi:thioredoxin reductase (NADPH)
LQQRAFNHPKIKFIWNSVISEILGDETVRMVKVKNVKNGEVNELVTDGVFIFIGHIPSTQLFADSIELDERGYIKTDQHRMTNVAGVFVAGEAGDPDFRQVVTSAGMGAAAAMQAIRFLEKNEAQQPEPVKS